MTNEFAACVSRTFLQNLLHGTSSLEVICSDVFEMFPSDSNQFDLLVLKLIEAWSSGVNTPKNNTYRTPSNGNLSAERVATVVTLLKCEKIFSQILLLIPERMKKKLIADMCDVFKEAEKKEYCELKRTLLEEACTNYSQNIMQSISKLDIGVVDCFFANLTSIVKCSTLSTPGEINCLLYLLNNIIGKGMLSGKGNVGHNLYDFTPFSLLNKHGSREAEKLISFCKAVDDKSNQEYVEEGTYCLKELLATECYPSFLLQLLLIMSYFFAKFDSRISGEGETLLQRILIKTKRLHSLLSNGKLSASNREALVGALKDFHVRAFRTLADSDLVEAISHIVDSKEPQTLYGKPDLLYSNWKAEKDVAKKFSMGVICLNNLYYGHDKVLSWLLSREDITEDQSSTLVNCLSAYTVNYGSMSLIHQYMSFLYSRRNKKDMLTHTIKQVVLHCLPFLNASCCNSLISASREYFREEEGLLWSSKYTKDQFLSSLNELINKLTKDRGDNKSMFNHLARSAVVSPFIVLREIISRIFGGTLKHMVFKSVMLTVPSIFELSSSQQGEEWLVIGYIKHFYVKHKNRSNSTDTIVAIIGDLIEVSPDSLKVSLYHKLIDTFILSNLSDNAYLDIKQTLKIANACLEERCIGRLALKDIISLCNSFLRMIDKKFSTIENADIYDDANKNLKLLILKLMDKFKNSSYGEQESTLISIKQMLGKLSWCCSFYFYSFFVSVGYPYKFSLPRGILEFGSCLPDDMVILKDDESHQGEEKWSIIFQISLISHDAVLVFLEYLPVAVADDEVPNIIQCVANLRSDFASIGKAKAIMDCLQLIVTGKKLEGIESYFKDDLANELVHHGICFSILILIQSFIVLYSEESGSSVKHCAVQNHVKDFHLLLMEAKRVETVQTRSSILLYMFEQLMYGTTLLNEAVTNILSLLLMDVLMSILESRKHLSKDVADQVAEQCRDILDVPDERHSAVLWEKYNATVTG